MPHPKLPSRISLPITINASFMLMCLVSLAAKARASYAGLDPAVMFAVNNNRYRGSSDKANTYFQDKVDFISSAGYAYALEHVPHDNREILSIVSGMADVCGSIFNVTQGDLNASIADANHTVIALQNKVWGVVAGELSLIPSSLQLMRYNDSEIDVITEACYTAALKEYTRDRPSDPSDNTPAIILGSLLVVSYLIGTILAFSCIRKNARDSSGSHREDVEMRGQPQSVTGSQEHCLDNDCTPGSDKRVGRRKRSTYVAGDYHQTKRQRMFARSRVEPLETSDSAIRGQALRGRTQ